MAIKTKEELLNAIQTRFGDDASDEVIAFIEDIDDTISDYESKISDTTDWKSKYETNDAEWRKKYRDRFFSTEADDGDDDEDIDMFPKQKLKYEDLFSKGD